MSDHLYKFFKPVEEETMRVRQHKFITEYIAAYMQGLHKGVGGFPPSSGVSQQEERSEVHSLRQ
jgi:hypothetical protein